MRVIRPSNAAWNGARQWNATLAVLHSIAHGPSEETGLDSVMINETARKVLWFRFGHLG
jgi:hypothetical protein